ncbi:hypothetical protein NDU88_000086 [Pleurodeles waltl]|uniref:Uncharacterized protein n=1 Tax=Pleurodeles waltl TaxID=8319 RepID=A0AAV7S510_PLEWA|nr:hypothetical protein NDU88_000086 [Pleurodeles waltl]
MHTTPGHHEDPTWLTPRTKQRKKKHSKGRPSRAQAVKEREEAIKEAVQLSTNSFYVLTETHQFPSDTDMWTPQPSRGSLDDEGPTLIPRFADYLSIRKSCECRRLMDPADPCDTESWDACWGELLGLGRGTTGTTEKTWGPWGGFTSATWHLPPPHESKGHHTVCFHRMDMQILQFYTL